MNTKTTLEDRMQVPYTKKEIREDISLRKEQEIKKRSKLDKGNFIQALCGIAATAVIGLTATLISAYDNYPALRKDLICTTSDLKSASSAIERLVENPLLESYSGDIAVLTDKISEMRVNVDEQLADHVPNDSPFTYMLIGVTALAIAGIGLRTVQKDKRIRADYQGRYSNLDEMFDFTMKVDLMYETVGAPRRNVVVYSEGDEGYQTVVSFGIVTDVDDGQEKLCYDGEQLSIHKRESALEVDSSFRERAEQFDYDIIKVRDASQIDDAIKLHFLRYLVEVAK